MKTILVTGAYGFIGKNLCAKLETEQDVKILKFGRQNSDAELASFVDQADFILHVAGVNRPKDEVEFQTGNTELTERIVALLEKKNEATPLLITSSTHAEKDNAYGLSKKAAEDAVLRLARDKGSPVYIFRLPNVFGKWSRPEYNSAIATFCNNISRDLPITVSDPAISLSLVYIDDVVASFIKAVNGQLEIQEDHFYTIPRIFTATLGEIVEKITTFKTSRDTLIVPDFENSFDRFLYATFTSFFEPESFDYPLEMKKDERGWLSEFIKSDHFGQVFVSRTKPGVARGNHWHHTKIEKFLVIDGQADIKFRKLDSDEILTYSVTGEDLRVVDIPAGYIHSITNTGKSDLLTIFWSDEVFNPLSPDTYYQNV